MQTERQIVERSCGCAEQNDTIDADNVNLCSICSRSATVVPVISSPRLTRHFCWSYTDSVRVQLDQSPYGSEV